jgi:tagatose-1,6-bisphosphate aldolase
MNSTIQSVVLKNLELFKKDGLFSVLAFDHRGSFVKTMQEHTTKKIESVDVIALKKKIIAALAPKVSGMLIDEDYGLPAYKELGISVPFLLPVEKTGYTDQKGERITVLERNASQLKALGAKGVKLLLYVHHLAPSWAQQMETAKKVIEDAHSQGLPVFLEFVLYSLDNVAATTVVATVEKAIGAGVLPDVWKLPYPGSVTESREVSRLVGRTPWVLLTGGGTYETFRMKYKESLLWGVSGFVAGRSLWQEACTVFTDEPALQLFLQNTLPQRFARLN